MAESARLAERLRFDLTSDLGYSYPGAEDENADRRLAELCRARMEERYSAGSQTRAGHTAATTAAKPSGGWRRSWR